MNNDTFLDTLLSSLTQTAGIKTVFGEPVRAGDKVIIPVARVVLGTGGGYGHGRALPRPTVPAEAPSGLHESQPPGGGGGGGGLYVSARGVFEITPEKTRFVAARNGQKTLLLLAVGFLLGRLLAGGHHRKAEH